MSDDLRARARAHAVEVRLLIRCVHDARRRAPSITDPREWHSLEASVCRWENRLKDLEAERPHLDRALVKSA